MGIERQAARFLVDLADAINTITSGKTSYGEFYVSDVRIGFEGEDTRLRIVVNENGGLDITEDTGAADEQDLRGLLAACIDRFVKTLPATARPFHPATQALDGIVNDPDSNEAYVSAVSMLMEHLPALDESVSSRSA